jgi:hypothetical protein
MIAYKSDSDGDGEEGEKRDEDVVVVEDDTPPKEKVYNVKCLELGHGPTRVIKSNVYYR